MAQVQVSQPVSLSPNMNEGAGLSLLSLSIAAASASPIPVTSSVDSPARSAQGNSIGPKHRRLSSTGKTRRRLSDARDAATRPSPASVQTAAAALSALSTLSLSSSPPPPAITPTPASFRAASQSLTTQTPIPIPASRSTTDNVGSLDDTEHSPSTSMTNGLSVSAGAVQGNGTAIHSVTKNGKKRGTIFTCESCSKVYRHPSCLIKHRWEHTPQWREASKFVLSKHQQVQLLEAAAILSHLSPSSGTGTSLPEDRSLWPAFLSGGLLPQPTVGNDALSTDQASSSSVNIAYPVSSSVPVTSGRAGSSGPRLHDYAIPPSTGSGAITQLRPGLLGVPTGPSATNTAATIVAVGSGSPAVRGSLPVAVPVPNASHHPSVYGSGAFRSSGLGPESWGSPTSSSHFGISSYQSSIPSNPPSYTPSDAGWSLPRSSLRSVSISASSRSRSASESKSEDDEGEVDGVGFEDVDVVVRDAEAFGFSSRGRVSSARQGWKMEEEEATVGFSVREEEEEEVKSEKEQGWDGMEMDMEMD